MRELTEAEQLDAGRMRAEVGALVEISRQIDTDWKAGADGRSMLHAAVWAQCEAARKLHEALLAEDGAAFYEAAQWARERAFSATIHGRNWRKAQAQ